MAALRGSFGAVLGWMVAHLGESRENPGGRDWTPSTTIDDCALFQSAGLYGNDAMTEWNADGFKYAPDGVYHAGKAGLQRGDVVLYDWDGNGIANHVEMCLTAPDAAGAFQTIGVNGSDTIACAYRWRNGYVLGHFRPNYPTTGTTTAGLSGATAITDTTNTAEETDMSQTDKDNAEVGKILALDQATGGRRTTQITNAINEVYKVRLGRPINPEKNEQDRLALQVYLADMILGKPISFVDAQVQKSPAYQARLKAAAAKK